MSKTANLALRISPDIKWALEGAAKAEGRTVSNYVERVLSEHLRASGRLQEDNNGKGKAERDSPREPGFRLGDRQED